MNGLSLYIILVYNEFKRGFIMQTIGVFEVKTHLSALLDQVEKGEQILITKHGRPVAKLVPVTKVDNEQLHITIQKLKAFGKGNKLRGLEIGEYLEMRGVNDRFYIRCS